MFFFSFVHEELINCEDITPRRTLSELSYRKLGLLVLLQRKCSIWQDFMFLFWDMIRKDFNFS